jgi:hypothetical protein
VSENVLVELVHVELATDAETGAADTLVIRSTPWWLAVAEAVTGRIAEATGHRWCQLIAGRAERATIRRSRYVTVPITEATANEIARLTGETP